MIRFFIALSALVVVSCSQATTPGTPSPDVRPDVSPSGEGLSIRLGGEVAQPSGTLDAPIERVWEALPVVYQTLGIAAQVRDSTGRHVFGTRRFTERRAAGKATADLVRCGNQGAGPSAVAGYRIQLTILTTLRSEAAGRTTLITEITGVGESVEGTSTGRVRCVSTGELERRVFQLVAAQLKQ